MCKYCIVGSAKCVLHCLLITWFYIVLVLVQIATQIEPNSNNNNLDCGTDYELYSSESNDNVDYVANPS